MSMDSFVASINQMEKKLSRVVKATKESTLGQLGTVNAMAIDEFEVRVKAAVCDLVSAELHRAHVSKDKVVPSPTSVIAAPTSSGAVRREGSVSSYQCSSLLSAFGDALSVVPSDAPHPIAVKPGKNLIRSHAGFKLNEFLRLRFVENYCG